MNACILHPTEILLGDSLESGVAVEIKGGRIAGLLWAEEMSAPQHPVERLEGTLVPGFFDIQVNGGGGVLFNDDPSVAAIKAIGAAHRSFGTSRFLPTLVSDDLGKVETAIRAVDQAIEEGVPGVTGIHLEGPFLNEAKKGIHDASKFTRLSAEHIELLSSLKYGVTLITLAPELAAAADIRALVEAGVVVSAGHTAATYEQAMAGVRAGVTGFTHLFNAMTGFESRAPGAVGAAFDSADTYAGLIADGHHVHPAALRQAIRAKGADHSILVTDAMPSVGSDSKTFELYGEQITVEEGRCVNADGVLAGSDLDMASAVKYAATTVGVGLIAAANMASRSPARFMGIASDIGTIQTGARADFALLDDALNVRHVWVDGQLF